MQKIIQISDLTEESRKQVYVFLETEWGGSAIASRGRLHTISALNGIVMTNGTELLGVATYRVENSECELTTLNSLIENRGTGGRLIQAVIDIARSMRCTRLWLVTTNDNTRAMRFYQKHGLSLSAIHLNAMDAARKLKPSIPLTGIDGIPLLHELEFEMKL